MRIKVDEDIPPVAAIWLQERGYEASTVVDQGMGGWQDDPLWQAVQDGQQFLLTADKGFGDIRLYPPGSHVSVVLVHAWASAVSGQKRKARRWRLGDNCLSLGAAINLVEQGARHCP